MFNSLLSAMNKLISARLLTLILPLLGGLEKGPVLRAEPFSTMYANDTGVSMHCSVLSEYLSRDEASIIKLVREIRGIEQAFGLGINQQNTEGSRFDSDDGLGVRKMTDLNVKKVLSNKKNELKFALHNLERHHIHAVRTCGVRSVVGDSRCSAVSSALAPSLRFVEKLKKKIKVAEDNLEYLKTRDDAEDRSKKLSGNLSFWLKWANVPPFVLSVASGLAPVEWIAAQSFLKRKSIRATKALGLPATVVLVATMVWNTSSKRKSAAIHLDYMQTRDFLMSSQEELELIERKLLSSIGQEFIDCNKRSGMISLTQNAEQMSESIPAPTGCYIPRDFEEQYEIKRDAIESDLDDKILSSGIGFYDRDFDELETEEVQKMLGIAVGEIITLVASKSHFKNPYLKNATKVVAVGGSVVFGYSLYKSLFSKDKFEALKNKYFLKHRTIAEIQTLEEELAYLEALNWVMNSDPKALCKNKP